MKPLRIYKVYALKDGTVIDHIPRWQGKTILEILGLNEQKHFVTLGIGLQSKQFGWKDVVKIEHKELSEEEVHRIALVAPNATYNIIRDHRVAKKIRVRVPEEITGIVLCPNPKCITNAESVVTRFRRLREKPLTVRCVYCERSFDGPELTLR